MKINILFLSVLAVCFLASGIAFAHEDIEKHLSCPHCGMDRANFAHSRMYIEYDDGSSVGTCSLHCAALDLAINIGKSPKTIQAGDYNTKDLIDAEKAYWVLGGSKMGVMTKRAKWAFAKKEDAEKFIKENGGELITFEDAIMAAYEDMYQDTKMIRKKRKMMKMKNMEHKH